MALSEEEHSKLIQVERELADDWMLALLFKAALPEPQPAPEPPPAALRRGSATARMGCPRSRRRRQ